MIYEAGRQESRQYDKVLTFIHRNYIDIQTLSPGFCCYSSQEGIIGVLLPDKIAPPGRTHYPCQSPLERGAAKRRGVSNLAGCPDKVKIDAFAD